MTNDEAIKIIENYEVNGCGYCHQGGTEVEKAFSMAIEALHGTTVDAVSVIRCKDCKHWKLLKNSDTIGTCWMFARYPLGDSFCDKAERKEE